MTSQINNKNIKGEGKDTMKEAQESASFSWNQQRSGREINAFLDNLDKKLATKMAQVALSSEFIEM